MGDLVNSKLPQNPDLSDINFDFPRSLCHPNLGFEENLDRRGGGGGSRYFLESQIFFSGSLKSGLHKFFEFTRSPNGVELNI